MHTQVREFVITMSNSIHTAALRGTEISTPFSPNSSKCYYVLEDLSPENKTVSVPILGASANGFLEWMYQNPFEEVYRFSFKQDSFWGREWRPMEPANMPEMQSAIRQIWDIDNWKSHLHLRSQEQTTVVFPWKETGVTTRSSMTLLLK